MVFDNSVATQTRALPKGKGGVRRVFFDTRKPSRLI